MTLASTTNRLSYTGNGSTKTYSYTFKIFDETDLNIFILNTTTNAETELTLNTDYTVSGVGSSSGGSITLVDADQVWLDGSGYLLAGYKLTIRRVVGLTQETDIRNQGAYYPEIHEDQFDKMVMMSQQQQDDLDRSMKLPNSIAGSLFNTELPAGMVGTNGVVLMTNATGDGFEVGPTADNITAAQGYSVAAATAKGLAEAAQVAAETAQGLAETAQAAAELAQTGAETAQGLAEAAQGSSLTYADDAGFVSSQGSATNGDRYYNTTSHVIRYYSNGAWSNILDDDSTQSLTNKTFGDSPIFTEIATPSTPASGKQKIYPKTDGFWYTLDDAGAELQIISGAKEHFLATTNAGQSIPNGVATTVVCEDVVNSDFGSYNTSTGVYTFTRSGDYLVTFTAGLSTGIASVAFARVLKNGSTAYHGASLRFPDTVERPGASVSVVISVVKDDTIVGQFFHNSGSSQNLIADGAWNHLSITRM